jgi:hypothetical protein
VVTDIPITMENSNDTVPITVDMTTTYPWMQLVDPITGNDLKLPNGNVVLSPTSSKLILLKVDLPPDIESLPDTVLYTNVSLNIRSGSFPLISPTDNSNVSPKNTIIPSVDLVRLTVGETQSVDISVYNSAGVVDYDATVAWRSMDATVAKVRVPENTTLDYTPYTPRIIEAISVGETTIMIVSGDRTASILVRVSPPSTESPESGPDQDPTTDSDRVVRTRRTTF